MKAKLLLWLAGVLLLGSVLPAQANSCGSDCVNQCSGSSGGGGTGVQGLSGQLCSRLSGR